VSSEKTDIAEKRPTPLRKRLRPGEPFDTCVECGCERGFHLVPAKARRSVRAQVSLLLKCPNCGAVYDTGLTAPME